ncbi:gastrula zinc finger protein XlCGF67.1-like [Limulus polyphemus]|uniref:Gastrula zinc finger protein XlCGF67.1-like n=1 Tax=Limulus polyphemus TaxID=6850 RepID=A0ABM1TPM4_LIMPO|nr:gastrula zinc finger protein XlCGF67.1-like [Limulus polyphemus]
MNTVDYSAGHKVLVDRPAPKEPGQFSGRVHDEGYERRALPLAVSSLHANRDDNKSNVSSERGKINRSNKLLEGRSLPCPVCGKIFVAMKNLESHMKSHTKHRPYQCSDCGRSFSLPNTLVCHTRVHTKERPYACSLCLKSFTQASTLKSHVIYKHTKQFPHKCDTCGRGFISPGQKMEHVTRLHGPEASVDTQQ